MSWSDIAVTFYFIRSQIDWMVMLGLLGIWTFIYILRKAQKDRRNPIDLAYLLVDPTVGKVTLAKFAGFGAFLASTWVFFFLPVSGHFDTGYAAAYIATWAAAKVATDFINKPNPPDTDGKAG